MKELILDYLQTNDGRTPTQIGLYLGYDIKQASARVTKALQQLLWDKAITKIKVKKNVIYKAI